MSRRFSTLLAALLSLAVSLVLGCQPSSNQQGTASEIPSALLKAKLYGISLGYHEFSLVNKRPPDNIDELAPFLVGTIYPPSAQEREQECLREIKEGKYVVIWNQQGAGEAKKGTDILLAYEQRTLERGGFVVFADGRVEWMSSQDLERATHRQQPPS
jgi:hypothetical protein